jgi:DUF971 family protein
MNKVKPTGITADRNERVLKISWNDGHESTYPFAGLRAECPCAECKGGHEHMGQPPNPYAIRETPNEGINIENIEAVGSYAIGIQWSDGHRAGIYAWEFLREACPCLECAPPLSQ